MDTIDKIKELSKSKRMNQSRFVEILVEQYEEKQKEIKGEFVKMHNPECSNYVNILELENKVARIIESKNLVKIS